MYAIHRAELVAALVMADGKDRTRALEQFEEDLYAPLGGWEAVDREVLAAIRTAPS